MGFEIIDNRLYINKEIFDLHDYIIIKQIGYGANAVVFYVINNKLNRYEALKIWKPRNGYYSVDKERFYNEIRKNAQFKDDKIATVYYADVLNGHYYALLEYCEGITLKEYLKNEITYIERVYLLHSIVSTMWRVYKNDLFHGDLHNKNIIIYDTKIKILDFGTSIYAKDKAASQKRDAHMLFDLSIEILPEIKDFTFFNAYVREQESLVISECVIWLISLLCFEINDWGMQPYDSYLFMLADITINCFGFCRKDIINYVSNNMFLEILKNIENQKKSVDIAKIITSTDNVLKDIITREESKYFTRDFKMI